MFVPAITGDWRTIAQDPDLGLLTGPDQQPVDFGIWQAADGSWQLWSCIRKTRCGGNTRLFYRWEAAALTDANWRPMGIAMQADPRVGETLGGLQSPFVVRANGLYHMLYGDWESLCLATSPGGRIFTRHCGSQARPALFTEGPGANTRDPMVLRIGDLYHCYYTAFPNNEGAVYCRTSSDLRVWSESKVVAFGGSAGTGPSAAECPFVVHEEHSACYYLFRTQRYGLDAQTTVYRSSDPLYFGIDDDRYRVCTMPFAAPETIVHGGKCYLACLLPDLKGIRIAQLEWLLQ
jgi:hypothetical protein